MTKLNDAFWRWFGDSVIVDSRGNPISVCHASNTEFNRFRVPRLELGIHFGIQKQCRSMKRSVNRSFYLSIQNPFRLVDSNTWTAPKIVRTQNGIPSANRLPIGLENRIEKNSGGLKESIEFFRIWLEDNGFDGAVYLNRQEGLTNKHYNEVQESYSNLSDEDVLSIAPEARDSYIVWHPEQIKAIDNDNTWDMDDDDIRSNPRRRR